MFSLLKRLRTLSTIRVAAVGLLAGLLIAPATTSAARQDQEKKKPDVPAVTPKEEGKLPTAKELEKDKAKPAVAKLPQAEATVELTLLVYGGRKNLETARAAIQEEGTIRLATDQGDLTGLYKLRSTRKEKSWLDLLRVDLELTPSDAVSRGSSAPAIKYIIGFNGATVWSAQNNQYVNPRPDAEVAFRAQLSHEYGALLRYKEDGSKVEYVGHETVVGVETTTLDLTTANGEKTRYWISTGTPKKPGTYRILHAEYELQLGEGKP
ncbi:MAG TPA: hypothetical protein VK747_09445, partial [Blastocatellia bacterium]|nr:hypothetical protein [Blastocatellia bacterium]